MTDAGSVPPGPLDEEYKRYRELRRKHFRDRSRTGPAVSSSGYSDQYVAWVDILGWSDVMTGPEASSADTLARIDGALNYVSTLPREVKEDKELADVMPILGRRSNIDVSIFSDTIVILAPDALGSLSDLFWRVSTIWHNLLVYCRFSCRGAIVHGGTFYNGFQAIGPAIAEAARIEKTVAIYPRIVISDSVMTQLERPHVVDAADVRPSEIAAAKHASEIREMLRHVRTDACDGVRFLDVLVHQSLLTVPSKLREFIAERVQSDVEEVEARLRDEPGRASTLARILAKKMWVKNYFENHIAEVSKSGPR